ncbi:MAG: hypothetical protein GY803_20005 [Chloroflexi bacterium]|nr:hypothetical protein [Chloroflexota bacterium]
MSDELDFLTHEDSAPAKKKDAGFLPSMSAVSAADAQKASGRGAHKMHGKDEQWTFRLPQGTRAEVVQWADDLGLKQVDLKKWLVQRGLDALRDGERPEMEVVEVVRIKRQ